MSLTKKRPRNAIPVRVFREMGLGIPRRGRMKVVAGLKREWWMPDFMLPTPLVVKARIIRLSIIAFIFVSLACEARANEVCVDGVCRTVETGPLVKDFQQDVNTDPPKPALKHRVADWKFWLVNGLNIGSAIADNFTIGRCRADHGIGPCSGGGYGEFRAREGIRDGLAGVLTLVSFEIKSIEDDGDYHHKFWWAFPVGNTAYNLVPIIQNATRRFPPKEKD